MRSTNLVVSDDQARQLETIIARHTSPQRLVLRANLVLHVAAGHPVRAVARLRGCRAATVRKWCRRFATDGLAGLADASRPGRPRRITPAERCSVIATACAAPEDYGLEGHSVWSGTLLARAVTASGRVAHISARSAQRILKLASIKPHRCAYWKRRTDPDFDVKMRPIVELYVNPPADGPVVCADEKTCIQALQRRYPDLRIRRPGELSRREVEYKRHGTRCLTAGLFVHTGEIFGIVTPTRPREVFLAFLDLLDTKVPDGQVIHLVVDNLNTHRGKHIDAWHTAHPGRLVIHYLPFHASWLNQIELWFNTLQRRCLRRGDFASGDELHAHILAFPGEIWEIIGDPAHYASVIHGVTRWEPCRPSAATGVGARYAMRMHVGSTDVGGEVEVVEYHDSADLAWNGVTGIEQRGRWRVREVEPGVSTLTLRIAYQSPGGIAGLIADQVSARQVRDHVRRTLAAVRDRLEDADGASTGSASHGPVSFIAHRARAAAVLAGAGVIRPVRPDRLLAAALEVHRWGMSLAGAYAAAAALHPDATALVDDAGELTFADVDRRTTALARGLAGFGIVAGDRVAIVCRNHSGAVEAGAALAKMGADAVLIDPSATATQIERAVRAQGIGAVVHDQDLSAVVERAVPASRQILAWTDRPTRRVSLDQLRRKRSPRDFAVPERAGRFTVLATGSDGAQRSPSRSRLRSADPGVAILSRVPLRARQPIFLAAPISHAWVAPLLGVAATLSSAVVLQRRFDPQAALAAIAEHRVTALVVDPAMLKQLVDLPARARRRHNITSLEVVLSSAPLPGDLAARFMDEYGDVLYTVDGSTEAAFTTIATPADLRAAPPPRKPTAKAARSRR